MKVLLLTDGIAPFVIGGMQKHSYLLAKYLARAGVRVELHHCIYENASLPDTKSAFSPVENQNINAFVHHFPKKGRVPGHYIRNSYQYSKMLFDAVKIRLNEFDFIYTKGFTGWKLLEEKKKGLKMPKVGVKFHGYEMFQTPADLKSYLQFKLLQKPTIKLNKLADIVFSYGGKITDLVLALGVERNKIVEIPGAIEQEYIRKEITPTGNKIKFVFVGRYERRKGIVELHQALKELVKSHQNFEFHIIGPIPKVKQLKSEKIIYHGEINQNADIFNILDKCDVLVCPSHSEGMPNVILEGMARGLAILATDVGAVNVLVSAENGLLINSINTKSLKNCLLEMIHMSKPSLDLKKRQSLKIVDIQFTWEKVINKILTEINIKTNNFE